MLQVHFSHMPAQEASVVFQGSSLEACDLAQGLLRLDPCRRFSALEALQHRFERRVRDGVVSVAFCCRASLPTRMARVQHPPPTISRNRLAQPRLRHGSLSVPRGRPQTPNSTFSAVVNVEGVFFFFSFLLQCILFSAAFSWWRRQRLRATVFYLATPPPLPLARGPPRRNNGHESWGRRSWTRG